MKPTEARPVGTWDYIIVGAGSAGCVLANRLSEDGRFRVLVHEAGKSDRVIPIRVPAALMKLKPSYTWEYPGEPDESLNGTTPAWPAGKVLGGGSSINAMVWVRGSRHDYDAWAEAGCVGWDYDTLLPLFKRMETYSGGGDDLFRGRSGPLSVSHARLKMPVVEDFITSAVESGLEYNEDYNGVDHAGVSHVQVSQRRGLRHSSSVAFLRPAAHRSNLDVRTEATVHRVLFDSSRVATGVEYSVGGEVLRADARREVILSAGALATPKLLMLSGVGAGKHLAAHGVEVTADRPEVGENLQEHPNSMLTYSVRYRTLNQDLTPLRALKHGMDFVFRRRGAVTSPLPHALAFGRNDAQSKAPEWEVFFVPFGYSVGSEGQDTIRGAKLQSDPIVTMYPLWLHPKSRGLISLRSPDPHDSPVIQHNLLGHHDDVVGLTAACRAARSLVTGPTFSGSVVEETSPTSAVQSDEEWEAYLRVATFGGAHPSGTARMGADDRSVVDPSLRVRGVSGLRVVDASIMPSLPSGNTNATTMVIAERAADIIRADYR